MKFLGHNNFLKSAAGLLLVLAQGCGLAGAEGPYKTALLTKWGKEVTAENAWKEYPRPQLERAAWQNLNGQWDYAIAPLAQQEPPTEWAGKILVPFSLESKLGGVQQVLEPSETLWYRRSFDCAVEKGKRTLLNFEAVDYRCKAWVNGKEVGTHQGGNTPFNFDITDAVRAGQNELVLRVEDATEEWQLRGKQVLKPEGIWYTRVSGIWQTVWLEQVAQAYIEDLHIATDAAKGSITVAADVVGEAPGANLHIVVRDGAEAVAECECSVEKAAEGASQNAKGYFEVANAKLWSPTSPHLYTLELTLKDSAGATLDSTKSYAGIRTVGKERDKDGHLQFTLNGAPIFHWGPLDQGWWPDGLLTPPSDAAMASDIQFLKDAGFNMIRKHIKVEPRRYYYHCDQLGMMVWQDQPSAGHGPRWKFLAPDPEDAEWPEEHHQQYMRELEAMVDTLENAPSIVVWVPFNEAWGQHRSVDVGKWLQQRDPSRHVNIASGGNFFPVGDIADQHSYPNPFFPDEAERFKDFVKVVGEFGGHGFKVAEHLWNPEQKNWGYGKLPETLDEYKARIATSIDKLKELRAKGICAGIYTQTTDVEIEVNGLLTYDREVAKISTEEFAKLSAKLLSN